MTTRFFLVVFILSAIVQLLASLFNWSLADDVSKCMLLPSLCGYYVTSRGRSVVFVTALFFCWVGDVLLIFDREVFFLGGLVAFLTGHLLYILSYRQHRYAEGGAGLLPTQKVRFSLPIVLAGTGLFVVLSPGLGGLTLPVLIYSIVIVVMVMTAIFRYGYTSSESFWMVFAGAILFMVSDSLLALNKFLSPVPLAGFWIMLTYMAAQFLIVDGIRKHL